MCCFKAVKVLGNPHFPKGVLQFFLLGPTKLLKVSLKSPESVETGVKLKNPFKM